MSRHVRKGDRIVVIAGNDKGKTGNVMACLGNERVVIQGINMRKKHVRRTQEQQKAQILEMEMPVHISNVSPCNSDGKPVKLHIKKNKQGDKELVYKDKGKNVVYRPLKKSSK